MFTIVISIVFVIALVFVSLAAINNRGNRSLTSLIREKNGASFDEWINKGFFIKGTEQ